MQFNISLKLLFVIVTHRYFESISCLYKRNYNSRALRRYSIFFEVSDVGSIRDVQRRVSKDCKIESLPYCNIEACVTIHIVTHDVLLVAARSLAISM